MQNRDGVGRRSQSYLPTLVEQALDNAARLIHEYRLPVLVRAAHPGSSQPRPTGEHRTSRLVVAPSMKPLNLVGHAECQRERRLGKGLRHECQRGIERPEVPAGEPEIEPEDDQESSASARAWWGAEACGGLCDYRIFSRRVSLL
jgi:hypothetical protein